MNNGSNNKMDLHLGTWIYKQDVVSGLTFASSADTYALHFGIIRAVLYMNSSILLVIHFFTCSDISL